MTYKQEIPLPLSLEDPSLIPLYMTSEAAGADIRAHLTAPLSIPPGESALVPTGLKMAIPEGYEVQIRPRSGLALKHQITVLNTPGTIDADYRGELKVLLINHGKTSFEVTPGMRIAQLILAPVVRASFILLESIEATTARGSGGFGHTGG